MVGTTTDVGDGFSVLVGTAVFVEAGVFDGRGVFVGGFTVAEAVATGVWVFVLILVGTFVGTNVLLAVGVFVAGVFVALRGVDVMCFVGS